MAIGFFAYRGCSSDAEKTMAFAKTLLEKTEAYEKARKESAEAIRESKGEFEELAKNATSGEDAAKRFEGRWKTVRARHAALRERFVDLGRATDQYFSELDRLAGALNDSKLRENEHKKNETLRVSSRAKFLEAEREMARLDEKMKQGDDVKTVLALQAARGAVQAKLDEVRIAIDDAKRICDELEALTLYGRQLAGGNGSTSMNESPAPAVSAASAVADANDGSEARKPILAEEDGIGDTPIGEARTGAAGWADRCYRHLLGGCPNHRGKKLLGYAKAECDRALSMNPPAPDPRGSILYNLGLIERESGNTAGAKRYFEESLALRKSETVAAALSSLQAH